MTHTQAPWRAVVDATKLSRAWRGSGDARYLTLECGHSARVTGDRALVYPSRMRCRKCLEEIQP